MVETKFGILSDTHQNPRNVFVALDRMKREEVDGVIFNGDVGTGQEYIAYNLELLGESSLESYIQPGSHESLSDFEPIMEHFAGKYGSLRSAFDHPVVNGRGFDLVFLPGSDFCVQGGEYQLSSREDLESDFYTVGEEREQRNVRIINMYDLCQRVSDPEKTIVVSHVPPKFDIIDNCVDMAHFHQGRVYTLATDEFEETGVLPGFIPREYVAEQNGTISFGLEDSDEVVLERAKELLIRNGIEKGQVYVERKANRGNSELRDLYSELGITKAVSGHFHESVHRANDLSGEKVREREFVDELFWNASYLDDGKVGILTVRDDGKVKYHNISI
jgi:hypothetical protein